ncbi:MAG: recombinase family protein [Caldilineaceae bacterium]
MSTGLVARSAFNANAITKSNAYDVAEVAEQAAKITEIVKVSNAEVATIGGHAVNTGVPTYSDSRPNAAPLHVRRRSQGIGRAGTVRHLMQNESYIGKWHYGKHIGRDSSKRRAKEEWVQVSVPIIISQEIWDAAVRRRESNRSVRVHETGYDYLLKGMITCKYFCRVGVDYIPFDKS